MLNNVSLMGRLVADPNIQTITKNGKEITIARYRLAVGRDYKVDNTYPVDFIPCKAFGVDACFARDYFRKGDTVVINGRIVSEPYKKEGTEQTLFFTGIQVRKSYLARHRADDCSRARAMTPAQDGTKYEEADYSDLPPLPEEYLELPPLPEEEGYRQAYKDMTYHAIKRTE